MMAGNLALVNDHTPKPSGSPPDDDAGADGLLSDEPTIELVVKARRGDRLAVEALLQRSIPSLKRFAHGRLPAAARGSLDTGDLVQETVLHVLRRLDTFEPRHVGAMQAYLRQSVINRIRDEVRRIARHPSPSELPRLAAGGDGVAATHLGRHLPCTPIPPEFPPVELPREPMAGSCFSGGQRKAHQQNRGRANHYRQ